MRPSELPRPLLRLIEQQLADARSLLTVGCAPDGPFFRDARSTRSVARLEELETAQEGRAPSFDGAVVLAGDDDTVRTLALLRPRLADGARVLLVARLARSPLGRLRDLVAAEPPSSAQLASACDPLLLAGLVAPRVHEAAPGWLAVSASLPSTRDALDTIFEQPATPANR